MTFLRSHITANRQVVLAVTHYICFDMVNLFKSNFDQGKTSLNFHGSSKIGTLV
jgi:hypothetical protein